jgi:hypothetical protein
MSYPNALKEERGFIALYALLSLAFLVGVAVLAMAHWDGMLQSMRRHGGQAQAQRLAYAFIQERLTQEWMTTPRPWVPPSRGEQPYGDAFLRWSRTPLDGKWRAGARPWTPEWREAWGRLGARPDRLAYWGAWLEQRQALLAQAAYGSVDVVTDAGFLGGLFSDLGMASRWATPGRLWTTDQAGALMRVNLLGCDAEAMSILSGVDKCRMEAFLAQAGLGFQDSSSAMGYWRFDEWQALERWATIRPFTEAQWEVEVKLPTLSEPIPTRWRVSQEDTAPGNPWFRVQPRSPEAW